MIIFGMNPSRCSLSVKLSPFAKNLVSGARQGDSYLGGMGRFSGRSTKTCSEYMAFIWPGVIPLFVIRTRHKSKLGLVRSIDATNHGRSVSITARILSNAACAARRLSLACSRVEKRGNCQNEQPPFGRCVPVWRLCLGGLFVWSGCLLGYIWKDHFKRAAITFIVLWRAERSSF